MRLAGEQGNQQRWGNWEFNSGFFFNYYYFFIAVSFSDYILYRDWTVGFNYLFFATNVFGDFYGGNEDVGDGNRND